MKFILFSLCFLFFASEVFSQKTKSMTPEVVQDKEHKRRLDCHASCDHPDKKKADFVCQLKCISPYCYEQVYPDGFPHPVDEKMLEVWNSCYEAEMEARAAALGLNKEYKATNKFGRQETAEDGSPMYEHVVGGGCDANHDFSDEVEDEVHSVE